jgi:hypothetical protein
MNGKKLIIGSIGGTFSGIAINYLLTAHGSTQLYPVPVISNLQPSIAFYIPFSLILLALFLSGAGCFVALYLEKWGLALFPVFLIVILLVAPWVVAFAVSGLVTTIICVDLSKKNPHKH